MGPGIAIQQAFEPAVFRMRTFGITIRYCFDHKTYEHPADFLVDFLVSIEDRSPELATAMKVWPQAPTPIKRAIGAMVSTADDKH